MAFVVTGVAGLLVGSMAYEAISANKAAHAARGAVVQQQKADAAAKVKAEVDAAAEANNARIAQKRAYQANVLALGGNGDDSLGAPGTPKSVLAGGAGGVSRGSASGAGGTTSVLGAGAPPPSLGGGSGSGGSGGGGGRYRYTRNTN